LRRERPSPSNHISLGAVYMWAREFQLAPNHFREQIEANLPRNSPDDLSFGMAAAAAWNLGDQELAAIYWRKGMTAEYAVGGANTRTPLLLFCSGGALTHCVLSRSGRDGPVRKSKSLASEELARADSTIRPRNRYRRRSPAKGCLSRVLSDKSKILATRFL